MSRCLPLYLFPAGIDYNAYLMDTAMSQSLAALLPPNTCAETAVLNQGQRVNNINPESRSSW